MKKIPYKYYDTDREITLRHLSILGNKTYIIIRPVRYECPYCNNKPTTTQKLPWYDQRSPHTKAYENHVLLQVVNSTIEDTSIKEELGYEAIMGILKRYIEYKVNWSLIKRLVILGLGWRWGRSFKIQQLNLSPLYPSVAIKLLKSVPTPIH